LRANFRNAQEEQKGFEKIESQMKAYATVGTEELHGG
jgi:hypothetical protein